MKTPGQGWRAVRPFAVVALCVLGAVSAGAEVVQRTVPYPPEALAGWAGLDFDADGTNELSFEMLALGHESGGVLFLEVHTAGGTEVLCDRGEVVPLGAGNTVSLTPVLGQWQPAGLGVWVWSQPYSTEPGAPPAPTGRGVGMPGWGDYMGVRFSSGQDWHYGWMRLGMLRSSTPPFPWPSVLEYAFETLPNTPILVPEPSALGLLGLGILGAGWRLRRHCRAAGAGSKAAPGSAAASGWRHFHTPGSQVVSQGT